MTYLLQYQGEMFSDDGPCLSIHSKVVVGICMEIKGHANFRLFL